MLDPVRAPVLYGVLHGHVEVETGKAERLVPGQAAVPGFQADPLSDRGGGRRAAEGMRSACRSRIEAEGRREDLRGSRSRTGSGSDLPAAQEVGILGE